MVQIACPVYEITVKSLNISRTLEGYNIVDHIACRGCPNYIFILDLTPGFNGLDKDKCKTKRETLNFGIRCVLY